MQEELNTPLDPVSPPESATSTMPPKVHYPSPVPIRMSKGLKQALDREAAARGISRSKLVRTFCLEKLEGEVLSGEEMEHLSNEE